MSEIFNIEKILDVCNTIFNFFLLNLFFLILNIPLVIFFFTLGISNVTTYFPLFLLCSIPLAPSMCALFHVMNSFLRTKSFNIFFDLKKGIKLNLKQSLSVWIPELLIILVLHSNIKFFSSIYKNTIFACFFVGILLIILLSTPFIFLLMTKFKMNNIQTIKAAVILTITRPILTITNFLLLIVSLVIFEVSPGTTVIFIFSLLAFFLVFSNRVLFKQLQENSNIE
ncbi:hypothetical protein [uncultured Clostridium sp.]|uniref:hypothetical protein n=1 Tax=uncultured Clostridium sp. TaxID=59620 RepID=UPI002620F6DB|nr:hypothetical protein [uncultured Clostridium sp.]